MFRFDHVYTLVDLRLHFQTQSMAICDETGYRNTMEHVKVAKVPPFYFRSTEPYFGKKYKRLSMERDELFFWISFKLYCQPQICL